ncbi:MAG: single-stranded DNA-binding protein [Candidatus Altiarchaeum hamiconexum]|nr:single-stranded DNA-binding protein [Candidatus Altarchaeum hamiconexum]NCT01034.1 single-stranded DNA-binding protein [Candidatus Altarchaeum hamiconexum]PJC15218.1 MAG: single-stranded DNA-binding protein [Candidatus Altarchaeum sp. CG_4_9_14_0_8_um_filter_32_206]
MKVSDLRPNAAVDRIELDVEEVGEPRNFSNYRGPGTVATATVKDETGDATLTLWNEQINQVHSGDKVVVEDGFVKTFQGKLQISTGRQGKLTVQPE